MHKWLNALEHKLYRYSIPPIMRYLVFAMAGVFVLDLFLAMSTAYARVPVSLTNYLTLDIAKILQRQVWRLVTWLVVPTTGQLLYLLISLYFYYMIGTSLESRWGARRFLIYFSIGAAANVLFAILAHLITGHGYGVNTFLYYSLFIAFAALYPDTQFMLFYIIPVKAKWLAALDLLYFAIAIFTGGTSLRLSAIASLINVVLFFGNDLYQLARRVYFQWQRKRDWRR